MPKNQCPDHKLRKWPSNTQFIAEGLILLLNRPLYGLIQHLQSVCDYGCCFMDAFDISTENACGWLMTEEGSQYEDCIQQIDEVLAAIRGTDLSAYISPLQDILGHSEALDFFERIRCVLVEACDVNSEA